MNSVVSNDFVLDAHLTTDAQEVQDTYCSIAVTLTAWVIGSGKLELIHPQLLFGYLCLICQLF